jgi:hypothetical protein
MNRLDFKIDPFTKEKFIPGRPNQVYANSKNRIMHNNHKARELKNTLAYINEPVSLNRRILEDLLKEKKERICHKEFLLGKGYNFKVMTHMNNYGDKVYPCIYNFMIINMGDNNIKLRTND